MRQTVHGHLWTLAPHFKHVLRPSATLEDEPWQTTLEDLHMGSVRLSGWVHHRPEAETLAVLVHGLGGTADSRYVIRLAETLDAAGLSYLRLALRGADRRGEDFYHAAMHQDVAAALASPALSRYRRIVLIGFSMGGHISLSWACQPERDPRVDAVVSVCAPLDLSYGAHAIQRPAGRPYQWHVLRGLKAMVRAVAARGRPLPVSLERAMAAKTILEWDDVVVAPRFGFANRADYYHRTSVGPRLRQLELPTLIVAAEADPMVTADQLRPWLREVSPCVEVAWTARGGHVAFPRDVDLGFGDVGPLEAQLVKWLQRSSA
ncbi:MAG: YheT family hydrolase [Sandaracinaceae bacterium]